MDERMKEEEMLQEMKVINIGSNDGVDREKEFDKNYNNLLKLKQEMLETKEKKRAWKIFNCSLLKEKKNNERKLLAFVVFLFIVIIGGLIVIYCFHEEELYYIFKGRNLVVNEKTLDFEFYNHKKEIVASGTFWKSRPKDRLPYDCSFEESRSKDLCLLWKKITKLNVVQKSIRNDSNCYEVTWSSSSDEGQHDCFNLGQARWFGGGLIEGREWSLQKHSISRRKFLTGKLAHNSLFGPVLERYWLNSNGVAIVVAENSPLEISIKQKESLYVKNSSDSQFCLYAIPDKVRNYSDLMYTVCVAPDITEVHKVALPLALESANLSTHDIPDEMFINPFWSTWSSFKTNYNEAILLKFGSEIAAKGYGHGLMLVDDGWEYHHGDMVFDRYKFPNPTTMIDSLHQQGFKVSLVVHSQLNTDSFSFHEAILNDYLVNDAGGHVPGLTKWSAEAFKNRNSTGVAGILDISENAIEWQKHRLNDFRMNNSIDFFHFSGGEMSSLPSNPSFRRSIFDQNDYTKFYARLASSFCGFVSVESAYKAQNYPVIIRIANKKSTWSQLDGLQSVIPTALNLGLSGYRLFLPDAVGGSVHPEPPSKELYIRWLQLNTFLPFMHFSILPDRYGNDTEVLAKNFMNLRRKLVVPEILRAYQTSLDTEPIIKPVWWLSPNDKEALDRKDEFLVGDKILVAPIVAPGLEHRDIYLPEGLWEDRNNDQVHVGPKMLKSYKIPLDMVAYFIRK